MKEEVEGLVGGVDVDVEASPIDTPTWIPSSSVAMMILISYKST